MKYSKLRRSFSAVSILAGVAVLLMPVAVRSATETVRPNSAGSETALTPLVGANYTCVDEVTSDEDVTYVSSTGLSWARDIYAMSDHLTTSGTINSVTVYTRIVSTNNGQQCSFKTVLRINATTYEGAIVVQGTAYGDITTAYATNPSTASAWSWTDIDNIQAGVSVIQAHAGHPGRCTQVWVVVDYTPIAAVTWDGGGVDNNWSTGENWTGDAAPLSTQAVLFDGTSVKDCNLDALASVASITVTSSYTGTFSFGSNTLQVTGDVDFSGVGSLSSGTGTIELTGATVAQYFKPKTLQTHPTIVQNGAAGTNLQANSIIATAFTITSGTLNLGSGLAHKVGTVSGSGTLNFNTSSLQVTGTSANFGSLAAVTASTGSALTFPATSGTQTFTPKSGATFPPVIHSGAATLTLATNALICESFLQQAGILNMGNQDITTVNLGNFDIMQGTSATLAGHDGTTITIAGNGGFAGQPSDKLNMDVATGWTISATGTLEANYATIGNCDAGGSTGMAYSSTESPGNTNWNFAVQRSWDGGGVDNNWNTAENWSGDVVPASVDEVIFDNTSTKNCVLNVSATVASATFTSGYTGTFDFSGNTFTISKGADLRLGGSLTGGGTVDFSGSGLQLLYPKSGAGGTLPSVNKTGSGTVLVSGNGLTCGTLTVSAGTWNWGSGLTNAPSSIAASGGGMDFGSSTVNVTTGDCNLNGFNAILGTSGILRFSAASGTQVFTPGSLVSNPDETMRPDGAGNSTALTTVGGCAANWECVSEQVTDDATYVSRTATTYATDLYSIGNHVAGTGSINSVKIYVRARCATNNKTCYVRTVLRTNGTDYQGAENAVGTTSWSSYISEYGSNPNTSAPWSWTDIDNLQAGVSLRRGDGDAHCSQAWVVVNYSRTLYRAPVQKSGAGVLELSTNDLQCDAFTLSGGQLNFGGRDITITNSGNFSISNGTSTTFVNLAGRTITVAGDASFNGTSGDLLNMNTAATWYLNVTGNLSATYANIAYSNASMGSQGKATSTCTDALNNTNWLFNTLAAQWSRSSLGSVSGGAVGEGVIYVGTGQTGTKMLYALSLSDGSTSWGYPTTAYGACNTPSYSYTSTGYKILASAGNTVIGLNASGVELWSPINLGATAGNPYTSPDDSSFYVAYSGNLTKRKLSDGSALWTTGVANISTAADPVVFRDWVYVATTGGTVHKADSYDYTPLSSYAAGSSVNQPLIVTDNTLYAAPASSELHAVTTADMTARWSSAFSLRGTSSGAPIIFPGSSSIYAAAGNFVQKINDNGAGLAATEAWFYNAGSTVQSGPIPFGANVYFGRDGGQYYALTDAAGILVTDWPFTETTGDATSGPWVDEGNGRIIFGTTGGDVDAFAAQ